MCLQQLTAGLIKNVFWTGVPDFIGSSLIATCLNVSTCLSVGGLGALAGPGLASLLSSGGPAAGNSSSRYHKPTESLH